ncbi:MAG: hypothetical protein A3K53_09995 [Deltaproteobacteria bacterium RIFOXYB2_FULL_66_7]|nr:MAG: hypothetical protein A3K53_09995 [Deltaproteobacteria bacterium RIFOXYB2_FULL_66_7]
MSRSPDTSQQILTDLQTMTTERSVEAQELLDMVQDDIDAKVEKQKAGKPATALIDRVRDKIEKEYKDLPNKDALVGYLGTVISKELTQLVRKETAQMREQLDRAGAVLASIEQVIGKIHVGVVVVDEDGAVESVIHSDMMPDFAKGTQLPQELLDALAQIASNTVAQYKTVRIIETHRNEDGKVNAFLFVPEEASAAEVEEPAVTDAATYDAATAEEGEPPGEPSPDGV